jgi:hypothetical protein
VILCQLARPGHTTSGGDLEPASATLLLLVMLGAVDIAAVTEKRTRCAFQPNFGTSGRAR